MATVNQIIEHLKQFDGDMSVCIGGSDGPIDQRVLDLSQVTQTELSQVFGTKDNSPCLIISID